MRRPGTGLGLVSNTSVTRRSRCPQAGPGLQMPDQEAEGSPRTEDRKAPHREPAGCGGQSRVKALVTGA